MEDQFLKQAKEKFEALDKEESELKEKLKTISGMRKNLKSFLSASGVIEGKKRRGRPKREESAPKK